MYRKASSTSVLCGVPSGKYTGGKRVVDAALLDPSTRERLAKSLSMRGSPAAIAYERAAAHASARPVWGLIAATTALSCLFAIGFGNLDSDWATQPWWSLALYVGVAVFFASSLLPLLRRRALFGGGARDALRPGRYVFPLDAIEIDLPDAAGRQLVSVYPLGDARHADIQLDGKRVELLLRFEGGESLRFPLRGDHKGTVALRRLEHAQKLLEDLTYKHRLEDAFANDLFFDLRVDDGWERYAPGAAPAPVRAPNLVSLALGRLAPAVVAVIALGLGAGSFFLRREAGDTALYNHAMAYGSVDAIDRYLARGGRRRLAAQDYRTRLLQAEKDRREREQGVPSTAHPFDAVEEAAIDRRCIDALEAKASTAHPKGVPALVRAIESRQRMLYFAFDARTDPFEHGTRSAPSFNATRSMTEAQRILRMSFGHVLADICPSSVLGTGVPRWGERASPRLVISSTAHWTGKSWSLLDPDHRPLEIEQLRIDAHVELLENEEVLESFDLSVPPPPEPVVGTRVKSLFTMGETRLPPGVHDERVYDAMVARAYDRIYDELWSLFFSGDPRVPLVPTPVLER